MSLLKPSVVASNNKHRLLKYSAIKNHNNLDFEYHNFIIHYQELNNKLLSTTQKNKLKKDVLKISKLRESSPF